VLDLVFWKSESGNEPVRDWLLRLSSEDRRAVGRKMMTVQFRWPLGMPTVRKIEAYLWEVRINLADGKIGRMMFTIFESRMLLLHGFIKKSQKTSAGDLQLARNRK